MEIFMKRGRLWNKSPVCFTIQNWCSHWHNMHGSLIARTVLLIVSNQARWKTKHWTPTFQPYFRRGQRQRFNLQVYFWSGKILLMRCYHFADTWGAASAWTLGFSWWCHHTFLYFIFVYFARRIDLLNGLLWLVTATCWNMCHACLLRVRGQKLYTRRLWNA